MHRFKILSALQLSCQDFPTSTVNLEQQDQQERLSTRVHDQTALLFWPLRLVAVAGEVGRVGAEDGAELELLEQDLVESLLEEKKQERSLFSDLRRKRGNKNKYKTGGNYVPLAYIIVEMILVFCPVS